MITISKNALTVSLKRLREDDTETIPKLQVKNGQLISGSDVVNQRNVRNFGFDEIKDTDKLLLDTIHTTYQGQPITILDTYRSKQYTSIILDYNWEVSYERVDQSVIHKYYHINLEFLILEELDPSTVIDPPRFNTR